MSVHSFANAIYHAVKDDASSIAAIRAEYASLALKVATDPNGTAQVTSSTINGQTFTATVGMRNTDRLQLLRRVIACLDAGTPISSMQLTEF